MTDRVDRLRSATHRFLRAFGVLETAHTPCGLPLALSDAHALQHLVSTREKPTVTELGRVLGIDKSNATRLCQRLARRELVVLTPCDLDGRAKRVSLTREGARLARRVSRASRDRFAQLLAGIPAAKRAQVLESLDLLHESLLSWTPSDD